MLNLLKRFVERLEGGSKPLAAPKDELAGAVAVLLAKAAAMDGGVDAEERVAAMGRLVSRFGVPEEEAAQLMTEAEAGAEESVELYGFTKIARDRLDEAGRVDLMEAMWEVVYSDGTLHDYEAQLMRRLAGLLYVPDRDSAEARSRALAKLGLEGR